MYVCPLNRDIYIYIYKQKQNQTEIWRFDWFIERITNARGCRVKKLHARELFRNRSILRFDVALQHDWPIEQCLLHIRVFVWRENEESVF